jgi:hypothetical protein
MAITFTIAGVAKSIRPGWKITEQINGRSVLRFALDSLDGSYRPADRAAIAMADGATTLYGGSVHAPSERGFGGRGHTAITNDIAAIDFNALPDRRHVALTIPAGSTLKQALMQIQTILSGYSVTLHASQANGPTFDEDVVFEFGPLTDILNKLSVMTGWAWEISYDLKLRMFAPGEIAAPWNITEDDGKVIGDIRVTRRPETYANYITVRFTNAAVAAYAILSASSNWTDGMVVEVGSRTYTFRAVLASADDVKLGATVSESLDTLHRALTLGGTPGTDYHADTTVNGQVTAYRITDGLVIQALQAGASGNAIGVSTDNPDATFNVAGGALVSSLMFGVDASLTASVFASSGAAPADRVDKTYEHPEITDESTAQRMADGYLARDLVTPQEITFRTYTAGLHPGQVMQITESRRGDGGLSGNCLITNVDISQRGTIYIYDVTAVAGLVIPEAKHSIFKLWSKGGGSSSGASFSGGGVSGSTTFVGIAPLGGSDGAAIAMDGAPSYKPVRTPIPFVARASFTALVRVWAWTRTGGVEVTARLRNVTDSVTAGEVGPITGTSLPADEETFNAPIETGKKYRLEVIGDTADEDVYAYGTLEAA